MTVSYEDKKWGKEKGTFVGFKPLEDRCRSKHPKIGSSKSS